MMKIEWIIIAEGLGSASNGAMTVIGINQNLVVTQSAPVITKRAVIAHLVTHDGSLADKELGVSIKVLAPAGQVLAAQTVPAKTGTPLWADMQVTFDIFAEFPLRLPDYGDYTFAVEVTGPSGETVTGQTYLYVRKPV
jgi:hypothetical protein